MNENIKRDDSMLFHSASYLEKLILGNCNECHKNYRMIYYFIYKQMNFNTFQWSISILGVILIILRLFWKILTFYLHFQPLKKTVLSKTFMSRAILTPLGLFCCWGRILTFFYHFEKIRFVQNFHFGVIMTFID